MGTSRQMGFS